MMDDKELQRLRTRVENLETALHAMWSMLCHLQPPDTQRDIGSMLEQHFNATTKLAGGISVEFSDA